MLAELPQVVALNKIDSIQDMAAVDALEAELQKRGHTVFRISAATRQGLTPLIYDIMGRLEAIRAEDEIAARGQSRSRHAVSRPARCGRQALGGAANRRDALRGGGQRPGAHGRHDRSGKRVRPAPPAKVAGQAGRHQAAQEYRSAGTAIPCVSATSSSSTRTRTRWTRTWKPPRSGLRAAREPDCKP